MNLSAFDSYVEKGLISKKVSSCGKLVLFDYTEKCQYERTWDEITLNARGTVYEIATGEVVAYSFPKFFNYSELSIEEQSELSSQKFTVSEKMDGSLGIIYFYDGEWRVNTRGSFSSDQAIKGKELLTDTHKKYMVEGLTYLVEIIYPENRIVVDYKGESKLTLLAIYNKYGEEINCGSGFNVAKTYGLSDISSILQKLKELSFNEEGYVVKFANGKRAKFKGEEYIKMHKIVSGTSPLTLWESMSDGKVSENLMASIPEEFRDQYIAMQEKLEKSHTRELNCVIILVDIVEKKALGTTFSSSPEHRKAVGLYLQSTPNFYNQYVFPYLLKKDVHEMIKKSIRPTGNAL